MVDQGTAATSPHYNKLGNDQPILKMLREFTPVEFMGYLRGNVIKYTSRIGLKEGTNDAAKAAQYQEWLDEFIAFRGIHISSIFYTAKD